MKEYDKFLVMVASEFHRYLMENDEFAKGIPANSLVIFEVEGEGSFNDWHKRTSVGNREKGQPISYIKLKKWRTHSTIADVVMKAATL
jgi:hypothetical protein